MEKIVGFYRKLQERRELVFLYFAMLFLYASSYFQRTVVPGTTFDAIQCSYGFTAAQVAGLGAAFVYVYSFCQLVTGVLVDRYSGLRVMLTGGVLLVAGSLLFPLLCGNYTGMIFSRIVTGLGASVMYLSVMREGDRFFGRKNFSVVFGILYFIGYSGGLVGTLPFTCLSRYFNWIHLLFASGLLTLLLYLIVFVERKKAPPPPKIRTRFSLLPMLKLLKNPYTWLAMFCVGVNFSCYFTIQTVFGLKFLRDFAGMKEESASLVIFLLTLVCMCTLLSGGIITRLFHNRRKFFSVFASCVGFLNTLFFFFAIRFHWPAGFFAAGYLIYAFVSGSSITIDLSAQELNSRDTMTQTTGVLNMFCYLLVAFFSPLIGMLLDSFVPQGAFLPGERIIYPQEAYATLFSLLLLPTFLSAVGIFFLPETRGHYCRLTQK